MQVGIGRLARVMEDFDPPRPLCLIQVWRPAHRLGGLQFESGVVGSTNAASKQDSTPSGKDDGAFEELSDKDVEAFRLCVLASTDWKTYGLRRRVDVRSLVCLSGAVDF